MNAAQLQAWAEQNKKPLLGVAGAVVLVLGLRARKKSAAGTTAATSSGGAIVGAGSGTSAAVQSLPYNSSASDAYNSLMPAIEQLYSMQEKANSTPTPVPDFAPGIYQQAGGDAVYQLRSDNTLDWLTQGEWDAMAAANKGVYPTATLATKDSRLWDSQLVGDGSKNWQPTLPAAAKRFATGSLIGQAGGQGIYQVTAPGQLDWLSQPEFDALAKNGVYPTVERLGKSDAVWQSQLIGDGTKDWH